MENLKINVYDENDNIIKTSEAKIVDLRFGTIRSLMELLNVEDIEDTAELLRTVYSAWSQITKILERVFPDVEGKDWDNIKLNELMPILVVILKSSFAQMLTIPKESKNSIAG